MKLMRCRCGGWPERIANPGGQRKIRCIRCGAEYSHPKFTWAQMYRVWNYANRRERDADE